MKAKTKKIKKTKKTNKPAFFKNNNDRVTSTWRCVEEDCQAIVEGVKFSDMAEVGTPRCSKCDSERDMELIAVVIDGYSQEIS